MTSKLPACTLLSPEEWRGACTELWPPDLGIPQRPPHPHGQFSVPPGPCFQSNSASSVYSACLHFSLQYPSKKGDGNVCFSTILKS